MNLDLATRRTICELVAGIITSDAKLDAREAAFVYRVARGLGIEVTARDALVPVADVEDAAARLLALPPAAQDEALRLLVDAACVDGAIQPGERAYLRAVGAALRIADEDLERRIVARIMAPG